MVVRPAAPTPGSIVEHLRAGTLDAELAATLWVLVERRVPVLVAVADPGDTAPAGASDLAAALLPFLAPGVRAVALRGADESFDWLPQAGELGWQGSARPDGRPSGSIEAPVRTDTTVIWISDLSDAAGTSPAAGGATPTWGEHAHLAVRASSIGYGLLATVHGDSLEDVLGRFGRPPVSLTEDERSRLGVVLIVRDVGGDPAGRRRVMAAHYVRPTARDEHGHVQRLGPAVLATWDAARDRFEHFGWGITPELASRIGWKAGDLESEIERRRDRLAGLADAGVVDVEGLLAAIDAERRSSPTLAGTTPGADPDPHAHRPTTSN